MNIYCFGLPLEWYADSERKALTQETAEQVFLRFLKLHFEPKTLLKNLKELPPSAPGGSLSHACRGSLNM